MLLRSYWTAVSAGVFRTGASFSAVPTFVLTGQRGIPKYTDIAVPVGGVRAGVGVVTQMDPVVIGGRLTTIVPAQYGTSSYGTGSMRRADVND